jgi:putative redox protein
MPGPNVRLETQAGRRFAVTVSAAGGQVVLADEPATAGGDDLGPSPYELLLASLGACTAMTVRLYADRKGWPLQGVRMRLGHERVYRADCEGCAGNGQVNSSLRIERITREIELLSPLDAAQRARLMEIAAKCPVHRTLQAAPEIVDRLVEG